MKNVPPGHLRAMLGITKVTRVRTATPLAIIDTTLAA
jgi:hypothetical protein